MFVPAYGLFVVSSYIYAAAQAKFSLRTETEEGLRGYMRNPL